MAAINGAALICLLFLSNRAAAKPQAVRDSPQSETFRLRIMNGVHGPIEVSLDKGKSWSLVGRVIKPASERNSDGQSTLPVVERVSPDGFLFGVGGRRTMKVVPESPGASKIATSMIVNMPAGSVLFKEFAPAQASVVQIVLNDKSIPIPTDYALEDNDRFVFLVSKPDADKQRLAALLKETEEKYREQMIAKWKSMGKKPTTGTLTINAALASGDVVGALTFCIDGTVAAILNRAPYVFKVDTRKLSNGEHLVEARGLDNAGRVATYKKLIVVIENL